ncbi:hypothetical protein B0H15DRAFT_433608 [Mycena belliarum]|uniref:DUF6534 domain-containing protein n=1 Tax=Mycena belliarum TaxID=1033014 RepID=A0AAD6XNW0_9AGAR|nr:hypothetical protein B0H15DRAFT_433608 [Mycena belliae]
MSVVDSNFGTTLGAFEAGVLISYVLFGFTTLQTYIYFTRFADDRRALKYLVAVVWALELGHAICVGHALYAMTVTYYGQPARLVRAPASLAVAITFASFVAPCVQSFFAHRIYRLSRRWPVPLLCYALSLARLAGAVCAAVAEFRTVSIAEFEDRWEALVLGVWAVGAANDVLIAGTLAWLFARRRCEGLPKRSLRMVDKLIVWTIETGVLTSIAAVLTLICFLTLKTNYAWLAWCVVTTRLFSNALLASLNSRVALRAMTDGGHLPTSLRRSIVVRVHSKHKLSAEDIQRSLAVRRRRGGRWI